ncbi:MAG: PIN domain-containing protein [Deltaproteobacteria bacterium]|nr:PIN domain-containing protein [Deltaproteobacteria bacterium]
MKTEKVFLDANILFSVSYGSSGLERFWTLAQQNRCHLIASRYVIEEARRNLERADQLKRLEDHLSLVDIVLEADPSIPCPIGLPDKDKPVLMSAISANAVYLITGDLSHFGPYLGCTIMGTTISLPRDYLLKK